jgi:uncharacterized membrane protein
MAGIGFELRKFLQKDSFWGLIQAYGYAGIISSGPWVLSILGIMMVGIISISLNTDAELIISFLISITYLIAGSIIFGAWIQLMFTRFVSDRLFDQQREEVLPNLMGALLVTSISSILIGAMLWSSFADTTISYRLLMLSNLLVLSNIWILVVMLSGLRTYKLILGAFVIGYGLTVSAALWLRVYGLEGLMAGFFIGQSVMMFLMLALLVHEYPAEKMISFGFLDKNKVFYSLAAISIIYNLGIWADKIIFWFNPLTSEPVIGPLRSAFIYDPPIFLAYLAIIPGMAVFLLRMEADFVDRYDAFFNAIREGDTLPSIRRLKKEMIDTIQASFIEIFKIQMITSVILIFAADQILNVFGISTNYRMLFSVDVVAVGVQVVLLGIFNVLFYLDKRYMILSLAILFAISNIILTLISQFLGPAFYGFGFAGAVLMTTVLGFSVLNRKLNRLEYETFMLQRGVK